MLKGSIDAVHNGRCYGWAMDEALSSPVDVAIFIDGQLAGHEAASRYRVDLEKAGLRDGRLAFSIEIPAAMRDGRHHRVEARTRDGRDIVAREAIQVVPKLTIEEFERRAPWIDRPEGVFEEELARLRRSGKIDATTETQLRFFREHGWLRLEQAVPHALVDALLGDVEMAWRDLPPQLVLSKDLGVPVPMRDMVDRPEFRHASVRYLDFHNASEAAAEIMMLPIVLRFVEMCFGEPVAAMQTLLFENGSEQPDHQDFAYVHSLRPACLIGAWVALEDVSADAGPLFFWSRSHRAVSKYVFADGSLLAEGNGPDVAAFKKYLGDTCRELGMERVIFTPRRGDVLLWHSALVHGGMPRNNTALTRKSMVSHYTTREAYPYDRRYPTHPPHVIERNEGVYFGARGEGHVEGRYALHSGRAVV